jgi:AAA domain
MFDWQVLYYNAEESLDEIKRRVVAICQHFGIDPKELSYDPGGDMTPLTVLSGHDFPLVVASADGSQITFTDHIEHLERFEGNVIILDPFVSVHQCPENDNNLIDAIVKRLGRVASSASTKSIELVHHARKPAHGGSMEITAADARGASGFGDGVRSLRVLNRMTQTDALRAKVENARNYFRVDGEKDNYVAASSGSQWFRHVSVILPNGDDVGVVVPWHFPGAFDGVTPAHMQQVRDLARGGDYRADPRSPEWIGTAVAEVLDLDADSEVDSKRIKIILKEWYAKGVLRKVERDDEKRRPRLFVEAGEFTE